ncbi:hypothetical protein [Branchiibius hedensis]|uniref:hypothetical protein n=1 Tax=Branchiibius hedensis TaxID=672460 RepID=UPI000D6D70E1|nr:hypothetical protein [Branchiibius hedensis]
MADSVADYLASAPEAGRGWLREFWAYVDAHYPTVPLVMFRGVPMYKFEDSYLKGYVMFTAAKTHFATHAIDFDLVSEYRARIPGAAGGKGNVAVKYPNVAAQPLLKEFVDAVMARHEVPRV